MDEVGEGLPLTVEPGKILSSENIENVTRELGPDFVIKTPTEKSVEEGRDSLEYLKQTKADYELLKKYVGDFVPDTFFIRANNKESKATNYIVQRRLKGEITPLHELEDNALQDESIKEQLLAFTRGVLEMDGETEKIPDMFGRPLDPKNPRFYNPRYADNICVVEDDLGGKRVVLTDVGAITEHKEKKGLHHKVSMRLVRRNLRKFEEQLSQ